MDQNIERKMRSLKLKHYIEYVRWGINSLREAQSEEEFQSLWKILEPEIQKLTNCESFVKYLKNEVIDSEGLWYNGASFAGKQKCNNSLEGINRYLKNNWTRDESKSLPEFFVVTEKAVDSYVSKCNTEGCMPTSCCQLRKVFKKAQIIIENNEIFKYDEKTYVFIRIPRRFKKKNVTKKAEMELRKSKVNDRIGFCKNNYNQRFSSLENYTKIMCFFRFYDTQKKVCNCNKFMNKELCKHKLAAEITLGRIKDPYQEKIIEGSQVGRPKNLQG